MVKAGGDTRLTQFAYSPTEALLDEAFRGNRNNAARDERFALAPVRTALWFVRATRVVSGGTVYLATAPAEVVAFNVGTGGTLSATNGGAVGVATDAESMAGIEGGIVRNGATFVAVGAKIAFEGGFYAPVAGDELATRDVPAWIKDSGGFSYIEELRAVVEPTMFAYLELYGGSKQKCEERLGPVRRWMGADQGGANPIGNFLAFTDPYGSGGEKTAQMLKLTVGAPRTLRVAQRAGLEIPAEGFNAVLLAYSFTCWGYPVCGDPGGDACDAESAARINALEAGQNRIVSALDMINQRLQQMAR
jgi:hypothetical protein